jgi:transposase
MLIIPPKIKVFAAVAATDMRKSFHGLIGIVEKELHKQIEEGDLFLFFNRRRNLLKVLFFTGDGAVILYKRLERGTFEPLQSVSSESPEKCLTLRAEDLRLLLEGIELSSVKRRKWWHPNQSEKKYLSSSKPS